MGLSVFIFSQVTQFLFNMIITVWFKQFVCYIWILIIIKWKCWVISQIYCMKSNPIPRRWKCWVIYSINCTRIVYQMQSNSQEIGKKWKGWVVFPAPPLFAEEDQDVNNRVYTNYWETRVLGDLQLSSNCVKNKLSF